MKLCFPFLSGNSSFFFREVIRKLIEQLELSNE